MLYVEELMQPPLLTPRLDPLPIACQVALIAPQFTSWKNMHHSGLPIIKIESLLSLTAAIQALSAGTSVFIPEFIKISVGVNPVLMVVYSSLPQCLLNQFS